MEKDQDCKQNFPETENKEQVTLTDIQKQIGDQTDFFTAQIKQLESQIKQIIDADQNHKQTYIQRIQELEEQKLNFGLAKQQIKYLRRKNQRLESIVKKLSHSYRKSLQNFLLKKTIIFLFSNSTPKNSPH